MKSKANLSLIFTEQDCIFCQPWISIIVQGFNQLLLVWHNHTGFHCIFENINFSVMFQLCQRSNIANKTNQASSSCINLTVGKQLVEWSAVKEDVTSRINKTYFNKLDHPSAPPKRQHTLQKWQQHKCYVLFTVSPLNFTNWKRKLNSFSFVSISTISFLIPKLNPASLLSIFPFPTVLIVRSKDIFFSKKETYSEWTLF